MRSSAYDENHPGGLLDELVDDCCKFIVRFIFSIFFQLTIPSGEEPEDEMDFVEESAAEAYEMHSTLLSKGFALERPPSVNQVKII